jgi:NADH:ubiquinone oxidoreductase subunit 5 (subunit L)/multisubunit Na+/H+ antiporter MnhA subunit
MFMAAGSIYAGLGHDRITGLGGIARVLPLSVLTFAFAGIALIGVQPSGASLAKDLLLQAAAERQQWWWVVVLQAGGVFTAAYVLLVLAHALAPPDKPVVLTGPAPRLGDVAALVLALCSLLLGLVPWEPYLPVPYISPPDLSGLGTLSKSLLPVLGGVVLAILLSPRPHPFASSVRWKVAIGMLNRFRRGCCAFSSYVERGNGVLCEWPAASTCLLMLALLFSVLMLVAA